MQSLDEKTWKQFGMSEVFREIYISPANDLGKMASGDTPCIGRSQSNNGFAGEFEIERKKINKGGCITVSMVGVPRAFFQKHDFGCSQNILIMRNDELGGAILQALCPVLNLQLKQYNYGYPVSLERFNKKRLMLPVTDSGEPDYAYMAEYTHRMREAMLAKYRAYVEERIAELGEYVEIPALDEKEWRAFHLEEIGTVTSGRDIYAAERIKGNTPYITSGGTNNGVGYFVGNINDTLDSGYIALNRNGTVGKAFYHPSKSLMGNDCRKVHLKGADGNLFVGQFVSLCLSMQSECFSYSRKLGTARAKRMQVMLPVTDSGEPDYEYMEQYVKNMMLSKYRQYLTFLGQGD